MVLTKDLPRERELGLTCPRPQLSRFGLALLGTTGTRPVASWQGMAL